MHSPFLGGAGTQAPTGTPDKRARERLGRRRSSRILPILFHRGRSWNTPSCGGTPASARAAFLLARLGAQTCVLAVLTALFGLMAMSFGRTAVFLSIASVGLLGAAILWLLMPETRPSTGK